MLGTAVVAQLGERQTEDLEVAGSIPAHGIVQKVQCPTGFLDVFDATEDHILPVSHAENQHIVHFY